MDLKIGDSVLYTRSTGLRVPAKVVGHTDEGYVELEYLQDGVRVINHHCPIDALSFGIPVTVAVNMLGNIVWICPLGPGTSADVLIWDGYGPSRTRGDFFDFEVGGHDGAYKGRIHVIVPFLGRKNGTLTTRQQGYNDVHGWYRARMEQLFARLWHWGLVRNIWRGGPNELHQSVRILLHFTQFCIRRQVRHPPYGPWEHVPPHAWKDQSNSAATQDEAKIEAEVCVLCCQRRSTVAVCDECKEHYCNECIDTHTCGTNVVC